MFNNYSAWPHNAVQAAMGRSPQQDRLQSAAMLAVMRGEDPCAAMAQQVVDDKRLEILEAAVDGERTINRIKMRQAAQQFRDVLDTLGVNIQDLVSALDDEGGDDGDGGDGGAPAAAPM